MPDMSIPRCALASVTLSGRIYAIGGQTGKSTQRNVEMFDLGSERWLPLEAQMSTDRKYTAVSRTVQYSTVQYSTGFIPMCFSLRCILNCNLIAIVWSLVESVIFVITSKKNPVLDPGKCTWRAVVRVWRSQ
jgi:hypothetical protein